MKRFFSLAGFSLLLSLYLTIIFLLGKVAPLAFLLASLAWVIVRQPFNYPERINSDIQKFAEETKRIVKRLAEILTYPLTKGEG